MYPYLFEIGPISIGTFGLMVALGFLAALRVLNREFKRQGLHEELGSTILTTCMVGGIVGAKLYFVLFETSPETWDEVFDLLFSGYGLTWYGGFVVATAGTLWQIRRHSAPLGQVADSVGHCNCRGLRDRADRLPARRRWRLRGADGSSLGHGLSQRGGVNL